MKFINFFVFILMTQQLFAQLTITGKVVNVDNEPIQSVNTLITKDSILIKGAVTNADGAFKLSIKEKGDYLLTLSFVGYETKKMTFNNSKKFGTITLKEAAENLDDVTVVVEKPLIQREQDKLIVNVAASVLSTGNSTLEILEKSPGIILNQDGNLTMNGRNGLRVLVDNKDTRLQGDDLTNFLRSMPSSNIEKVEIISNPSVRYEAQGNAGIINIVTKKGKFYGTNGSITLSPGQATNFKWDNSLNFNHRTEKLNIYGQYSYMHRRRFEETIIDRRFFENNEVNSIFEIQNDILYPLDNHNARIGLDYELSGSTNLGVLFSGFKNANGNNAVNLIEGFDAAGNPVSLEDTQSEINTDFFQFATNFNVNHSFKNKSKLTFNFDYARYDTDSDQRFVSQIDELINNRSFEDVLTGDIDGYLYLKGLSLDYELSLKNGDKFETGWKSTWVKTDNDLRYFNSINGASPIPNDNLSNRFIYDESVYAIYASYSINKKKWNGQLGLRAENTFVEGNQLTTSITFDNDYINLFPTASFNYSFNENSTIGISLGRRIDRPSYNQLNPFRTFVNTNTYREGNPFLTPQYTWNSELNYTLKQKYYFSFTFGYTSDNLNTAIIQDGELQAVVVKPINISNLKSYAFTASIPVKFTSWWQSNWNFNTSLNDFDGDIAGFNFNRNNPIVSINGSNSISLGSGYRLQIGVFHLFPHFASITEIETISSVSLGIQKSLLKNKASLRFNVNDIFYNQYPTGRTVFGNLDDTFTRYMDTRFATLSFTWRFGKQTVRPQRRRQSQVQDELNRARRQND